MRQILLTAFSLLALAACGDDRPRVPSLPAAFATIPLRWSERAGTLTLGARSGSFPGMFASREVRVVLVSSRTPIGHAPDPAAARVVRYEGKPVTVRLR